MSFEITEDNDIRIIKCCNRIDAYNSMDFEKFMLESIDSSTGDLGIDMSEVTFVSSAGLRAFIMAHKKLAGRGCDMYLIAPNSGIVDLLRLCGLDTMVKMVESPDEIHKH